MTSPLNLMLAAALALPISGYLAPAVVCAQEVAKVEPYVVVFTLAETPVRSGFSTIYYPICFPKVGETLVVDGETAGWLRVAYPANVRPIVTAEEADPTPDGKVVLNRASRLKALNAVGGVKGSFQPVLDTDAASGSILTLHQAVNDDAGKAIAYIVEAPASARGWVSRDAVRRATDSEAAPALERFRSGNNAAPAPAEKTAPTPAPTPAPIQPAVNPVPEPAPQPIVMPPAPQPVPTPAAASDPAATPSPVIAPPPAPVVIPTAPVNTPPGMEIPRTVPIGDKDGPSGNRGGTATPPVNGGAGSGLMPPSGPVTVDTLKSLYDRVRAQPLATAEFDQAIAEFERYKAGLGTSARDAALAKQADAYLQVLRMRRELRDMQTSNAEATRNTELLKSDLGKRIIELERQRVYNIIGRLVRSTVYNGERAPVLYRVMSPEPGSARTLGYLLPDAKYDYANKLEQVVGIIGEVKPDESLRTNLIVPSRVDVVSLAPIVVSPNIPGVAIPPKSDTIVPQTPAPTPVPTPASTVTPAPEMPRLPSPVPGTIVPEKP